MIDASWELRFNPYVTASPAMPVKDEPYNKISRIVMKEAGDAYFRIRRDYN